MPQKLSLVVDDEPFVRDVIMAMLNNEGFRTIEAENGAQAIELLRKLDGAVDLVVSDIEMPLMDGLTMACAVRVEFPLIPIILLSGANIGAARLLNARCAFIRKPFHSTALLSAVKKMMDEAPRERGRPAY
jgi:CheY-like chemotaxis protein